MNTGTQRLMAWSGPVLMVVFLTGFGPVAGFLPPPSPHDSVRQILHFYETDTTSIRLGLWITMLAAALCAPWTVAITVQLKRIEGRTPPLSYLQLILGGLFVLEFIFPLMIWQAAAFRPGASPVITQRLNDLGWLMFVGVVSTAVLQAITIGAAILKDKREQPIFPRWSAYLNFWCAFLFMPGGLVVFFKHGPFGWNGLIAWWLLLTAFGVWVLTMSVLLLREAIPHQEREQSVLQASSASGRPPSAVPVSLRTAGS
jgi:hypothetical protein